jgi:peptidoglycan/xylan/chitin deacetylase (PgdA/CDA1 family)
VTRHELSWPAVEGAREYRVLVREIRSERFVIDEVVDQTVWVVDTGALDANELHSWQVRWRSSSEAVWRPALPEVPLERDVPANPAATTVLEWADGGASAYRILIRDQSSDGEPLKLPVTGTTYLVDWSKLPPARSYRWRHQVWNVSTASWENREDYMPLARPQRQPRIQVERPTPAAGTAPRVLLMFTVDTEAHLQYLADPDPRRAIDDHIFCVHDGRDIGIGMIMDALDRHNFKGTFFLDILAEYQFGEGSLEPVVDAIKRRGHDIQLHLHTVPHLRFAEDPSVRSLAGALQSGDPDQFRRALDLSLRRFVERVGEQPVAYRSGAYQICDAYLKVLPEFGLTVDSSVYAFKNCDVSDWMRVRTQPFRVGPVLEVPVSWRLEWRPAGPMPMQFAPWRIGADNNESFTQLSAGGQGPPISLVYLAHSYSYLTRGPDLGRDEQERWQHTLESRIMRPEHSGLYSKTKPPWLFGGPDASRIELLERNLGELAARGDVRGVSMREVADEFFDAWDERALPVDPLPELVASAELAHLTATRVYSLDYLRHVA